MKALIRIIALAGIPGSAFAHPGHPGAESPVHWLGAADHLAVLAVVALAAAGVVSFRRRRHD